MNKYEFSVLILQYNPLYEAIERTVRSIIMQKNTKFEIVFADDGSKEDHFEQIRMLFQEYGFEDYVLVKNENNQGTVKNLISGLLHCKGKYVKCISPGDYLYSPDTLSMVYEKMESTSAGLLFGDMVFYSCTEDKVDVWNERRPYYPEIYIKYDEMRVRKHLLVYQDNISGASAFARRDILVKMMELIADSVVFQEDVAFSLLTFMDERIVYLEDYVVWYEYGGGISTNGENKWTKILQKDTLSYYRLLEKLYQKQKYVKRAMRFQSLEMKNGMVWKLIKTLMYPDRYFFRKKHVNTAGCLKETPKMVYLDKILRKEGITNASY